MQCHADGRPAAREFQAMQPIASAALSNILAKAVPGSGCEGERRKWRRPGAFSRMPRSLGGREEGGEVGVLGLLG